MLKHTLSFVSMPTTCGPTKPGIVAAAFVSPSIVPEIISGGFNQV